MTRLTVLISLAGVILSGLIGCNTAPKNETGRANLHEEALTALRTMQREDPSLEEFMKRSSGYAIFPTVGKGGVIVGGSYGRGEVYEAGRMTGYADITQATIGAQAGGQQFSELIVFQNESALERFKSNHLRLAANVGAVALESGAARAARYDDGVAVFVRPTGGLMVEASVGGQSFSYRPVEDMPPRATTMATPATTPKQ